MASYSLDGDAVRLGLSRDLGFSDADRTENIRRSAEVAKLMREAGLVVVASFISPFSNDRLMAKNLVGPENFIEVFLSTPLHVCETRDPKGLYKKARLGLIPNMTGINSNYESPQNPDLTIDTSEISPSSAVQMIMKIMTTKIKALS